MEKIAELAILFDLYSCLLTEKQTDIWQMFYNEDLSLSEISNELGISRQAVHDTIHRVDRALENYEEKLGLMKKFEEQENFKVILENAVEKSDWTLVNQVINGLAKE